MSAEARPMQTLAEKILNEIVELAREQLLRRGMVKAFDETIWACGYVLAQIDIIWESTLDEALSQANLDWITTLHLLRRMLYGFVEGLLAAAQSTGDLEELLDSMQFDSEGNPLWREEVKEEE